MYEPLFAVWRAAGWRVEALPRFGHDPRWPVTSGWPRLRDQLIDFIDDRRLGPAVLVGHSLGGLVSLMAACRRPDLARALVMLDSPVITGWRAHSLHMAKRTRLIARVSPGRVSRRRRTEWPTRDAVRAHFAAKSVFARWDARMLETYVQAGFEERDGRCVLAFDRAIETQIYDTLPHHLAGVLRRHPPRCPVGFIAGTRSEEMRKVGVAASRQLAGPRFAWFEGGHLFPMEKPDETAARVLELLGGM